MYTYLQVHIIKRVTIIVFVYSFIHIPWATCTRRHVIAFLFIAKEKQAINHNNALLSLAF